MMNTRICYIDVLRGLAILLVILGHSLYFVGLSTSLLYWYIYSYHMPLWFVIGGYLYKESASETFVKRKVERLLIPYAVFFTINMALYSLLVWLGRGHLCHLFQNGVLWFLLTLFLVSVVHFYLNTRLYNQVRYKELFMCFVLLFSLSVGLTYADSVQNLLNVPFVTAMVGYSFFLIGVLLQKIPICNRFLYRVVALVVGILLSVLLYKIAIKNGVRSIDMNTSRYENRMLFVFNALIGIISLSLISIGINRNRWIQWLGENSLTILLVHMPICKLVVYFFSKNQFVLDSPLSFLLVVTTQIVISIFFSYLASLFLKKYFPFALGIIR